MRRSFEYPTLRKSSSFSASKYSVVTSYNKQAQPAPICRVAKARGRDLIPVVTGDHLREVTLNRPVRHRLCALIGEHPRGLGLAGGLHNPGD
jgi:hypothetical protein